MTITINSLSIEVSRSDLYLRVPFLGALHFSRDLGLSWDTWGTLRANGEV